MATTKPLPLPQEVLPGNQAIFELQLIDYINGQDFHLPADRIPRGSGLHQDGGNPFVPREGSVLQKRMIYWAMPALEMKHLVPLIR